jgi:DNA-binding LytR/AlgR family response regulator
MLHALEALKVLQDQKVDLVFLDIQMPGLTGLQFIQSLAEKPMFILITAYEKYALDGYTLDVLDYLVKPVSLDRFIKACNKARELHELKLKGNNSTGNLKADYFFCKRGLQTFKSCVCRYNFYRRLKDYIKIHLKSTTRPVITRMSMKSVEEQLPEADFLRIHKSYIVSIAHITAIMKNSVLLAIWKYQ